MTVHRPQAGEGLDVRDMYRAPDLSRLDNLLAKVA